MAHGDGADAATHGWDATEPASEHVERARALAPVIRAAAPQADDERQLPASLMTALHDAGLFRLLLPRSLGGAEVDPMTFVRVIEQIARADASTAWCLCQGSGCSMIAAYLDAPAAQEIFGDARAVLAWGAQGGDGSATAVDGGYRVTGTWHFASGGRHASWLGAHAPVVEADGTRRRSPAGAQDVRTMLFPATSATMTDIWHVMGLRGTGSDSYTVTGLFVPARHAAARDEPAERRYAAPLYCFPSGSLYAAGFAGVALGVARGMMDDFVRLAIDKSPRGFKSSLRENAVIQSQVAQGEARLRSARAFLLGSLQAIWQTVSRTGAITLDQRMQIRLASTFAIQQAREVTQTVYHAAGSTAIFENQGFERRFRDMHAVTQQVQGRQAHFETVGQYLLDLTEDDYPFV